MLKCSGFAAIEPLVSVAAISLFMLLNEFLHFTLTIFHQSVQVESVPGASLFLQLMQIKPVTK